MVIHARNATLKVEVLRLPLPEARPPFYNFKL